MLGRHVRFGVGTCAFTQSSVLVRSDYVQGSQALLGRFTPLGAGKVIIGIQRLLTTGWATAFQIALEKLNCLTAVGA